jgi:hypothetical protein
VSANLARTVQGGTAATATSSTLLVNGSFDDGYPSYKDGCAPAGGGNGVDGHEAIAYSPNSLGQPPCPPDTIPGWMVSGGGVDWSNGDEMGGPQPDGTPPFADNAIDLNGTPPNPPGQIAQTVATVPGVAYVLTYEYAANAVCERGLKTGSVTAGSASQTFSANTTNGFPGWKTASLRFLASSSTTTITFSSLTQQTPCGPTIDAVTLAPAPEPPTITLFTPTSGITGSQVTITGTYLGGASGVKFGSLGAQFTIVSATEVRATVTDGALAGTAIWVTTPAGTAKSTQRFTPTLSVTSISPVGGPVGTVVDVKGIGFTPGSTIKFNGTAATSVSYINSGEIRAAVPAGATSGPLTLSTAAGTVRARIGYTVTPSVPSTITSFTPTSGITGSIVTITGTYFSGASVKFGNLRASSSTVDAPTKLRAKVPDGAIRAAISVITAAGTATSTDNFSPTLSITGYSPTSGPVGTVVDIKGIGFTPDATVKFNGTTTATVTYIGPGEVKATVPTGASTGPITLTTAAGTVQARSKYTLTTANTISGARPIATLAITTPLAA